MAYDKPVRTYWGSHAIVYDVHCHLHEYSLEEVEGILELDKNLHIISVSDDFKSSLRTLDLESMYPDRIIACIGLHPWSIREEPLHRLEAIVEIAEREGVRCIGEVGLDARFLPQYTWNIQLRIYRKFLELSKELGAFINIHAPNAWKEALEELIEYNIRKALFHWYTGPVDLLEVIGRWGYMISINPALRIQEKHARIALLTPLEYMVFESDAPYDYKGLKLNPLMVRESMEIVASIKKVPRDVVINKARWNSEKLLGASR